MTLLELLTELNTYKRAHGTHALCSTKIPLDCNDCACVNCPVYAQSFTDQPKLLEILAHEIRDPTAD